MGFKRLNEVPLIEVDTIRSYVLEMQQRFKNLEDYGDLIFVCGNEASGTFNTYNWLLNRC